MVVLSTPGMLHGGLSLQVTITNTYRKGVWKRERFRKKLFDEMFWIFSLFDAHAVLFALSLLSGLLYNRQG